MSGGGCLPHCSPRGCSRCVHLVGSRERLLSGLLEGPRWHLRGSALWPRLTESPSHRVTSKVLPLEAITSQGTLSTCEFGETQTFSPCSDTSLTTVRLATPRGAWLTFTASPPGHPAPPHFLWAPAFFPELLGKTLLVTLSTSTFAPPHCRQNNILKSFDNANLTILFPGKRESLKILTCSTKYKLLNMPSKADHVLAPGHLLTLGHPGPPHRWPTDLYEPALFLVEFSPTLPCQEHS